MHEFGHQSRHGDGEERSLGKAPDRTARRRSTAGLGRDTRYEYLGTAIPRQDIMVPLKPFPDVGDWHRTELAMSAPMSVYWVTSGLVMLD